MSQSENEDLVPRCAPKPSPSDLIAAEFNPSVPEISMVFSQIGSRQCVSQPNVTTYSIWKNKCMPNVGPSEGQSYNNEITTTSKRSNVYPLRTEAVLAGQIVSNKTEYLNIAAKNAESTAIVSYSLESESTKFSQRGILPSSYCKHSEIGGQQKHEPVLTKSLQDDVLTICAGTQTDSFCNDTNEHISNLATKEDIVKLKSLITGMQQEHRRLLQTIQDLLQKKLCFDTNKTKLKDEGTQTDEELEIRNAIPKPSHIKYNFTDEDLKKVEDYDYTHKQIPQTYSTAMCRLIKPVTDQSMVMNELEVKYLPNEKFNHMLEDVFIGTKAQNQYESVLKNKENLDRNPTDLSTASYKYLKKYRLLPEDNNNVSIINSVPKLNSENKQENLLDLDVIRCKPKFM
ncbi:uncharacterized protein LOC129914531 [Episyrphus balteatus]|uniref:uncharacterized protein LOC129914531 n=1 Tax=Episyrphus balteatus TaxID=286459 RepID=UPI00248516D5|nr:uncharacterized protein LOC129914531 [Episyrphus balteatus]